MLKLIIFYIQRFGVVHPLFPPINHYYFKCSLLNLNILLLVLRTHLDLCDDLIDLLPQDLFSCDNLFDFFV